MLDRTLFPPQQEILDHGILDLGFSSVISLPTGTGKTTLAEMAIDRALQRSENAIYLTPLKAIAEEKIAEWGARWPGRKVGIFTGDYESRGAPVPYKDAEILICTFERLDILLRRWQRNISWLCRIGLVVIDEFHLLMDASRGPKLEGAISRLRRVNPFCRLMGLSGTVSSHRELAEWLGGVSFHSTWRPVPLRHETRRFKRLSEKTQLITEIVEESVNKQEQVLIFVSSRRRAEQLAAMLNSREIAAAHHHAGLPLDQRRSVEQTFREGELACIVATPTLEMGLNLPCQTVVIADSTQWNGASFEPLPVWKYMQRAGRAGRPGQSGPGRAILVSPHWARNLPEYGSASPETVKSQLSRPAAMAEQLLVEVTSRACRTRGQLRESFLPSTLAFMQTPNLASGFDDLLTELIQAKLMAEDIDGMLHATKAGWVAVRHQLTPRAASHLIAIRMGEDSERWSDFDLLLHHCWTPDLQPRLPVAIETVEELESLILSIPSLLLDIPPPQTMAPRTCASGVLMAVLAVSRIEGKDTGEVAERLDIYPNDSEMLRENLARLLQASADLQDALDPVLEAEDREQRLRLCGPTLAQRIRRIALQLEFGLPGSTVYLTLLQGCGGKLARRLLEAGILDLEDLCQQEPSDLLGIPGIGPKRAAAWIGQAELLIKEVSLDWDFFPPVARRQPALPTDWPPEIEPGRLQRAGLLDICPLRHGFQVSGGAEDHVVTAEQCDCQDFQKHGPGWWCKHRLAVRLSQGDRHLKRLSNRLTEISRPETLAGHLADLCLGRRWTNG